MSPAKKPKKPIDVYIRVSKTGGREGESFISPEVQEERCRAMLAAGGYEAGKVFKDFDQSGRKMSRPAFDQAMQRARDGVSGGIVVWKLSRFGRSTTGVLEGIRELEEVGAVLLSTSESLDTSTPMGNFVLGIFAGLAELESEQIREGWKTAHSSMIERGIHAGRPPAGYSKGEDKRLVPNEHADAVRQAFIMKADPLSTWSQIARHLTGSGVPTQKGGDWTPTAARKLIANRAYLGEARHGKLLKENAHEALVEERTFRIANRKQERVSGERTNGPLLGGGLCRCSVCGAGMTVGSSKQNGKTYRFLRCQTIGGGHPTISLNVIEDFLVETALAMEEPEEVNISPGRDTELERQLFEAQLEIAEVERQLEAGEIPASVATKVLVIAERDAARLQETLDAQGDDRWVQVHARDLLFRKNRVDGRLVPDDVTTARAWLKQTLGTVTVSPGRGTVQERVTVEGAES